MEFHPLSTNELKQLARPLLGDAFAGVFAQDSLPRSPELSKPRGYIVNTDPSDEPGEHWMALWTCDKKCEVMDSFGLGPDGLQTSHLQNWLDKHWPKKTTVNTWGLQALTSYTCGHYCLYYLVLKSKGKTMNDFLTSFKSYDYVYNDHVISKWLKRQMYKNLSNS